MTHTTGRGLWEDVHWLISGLLQHLASASFYWRRMGRGGTGGFLIVLLSLHAQAGVSPNQPINVGDQGAPSFDVYTAEHGLLPEVWSAFGVDADGFVWAGSASSVARFDGYNWQHWEVPGASSLVHDFALAEDGSFWALFAGDGLARFDGEQWHLETRFPTVEGLFQHTNSEGERETWLTYRDGLAQLRGGQWVPDPGNGEATFRVIATEWTESLFGKRLQWIARQEQGGLWYRTVNGTDDYGPWQRVSHRATDGMLLTHLERSTSEGEEELWVLSYTSGMARITESGLDVWRAFDSCTSRQMAGPPARPLPNGDCRPATLPTEAMYSAVTTYDADGTRSLWVATRAGLVHFRGEQIETYDRRNGLPDDAIRGLKLQTVDGVDVLWVATEAGIARAAITENAWRTVSLLGARENGTFGVLLEPDGKGGERLWVGSSQRGLRLLENGHWQTFTSQDNSLPRNSIRAIWRVIGANDEVWRLIAFDRGQLYRVGDDKRFTEVTTSIDRRRDVFVDDVIARDGPDGREILVATVGDGVHRYQNGQWQRLPMPAGLDQWRVRELIHQLGPAGTHLLWAMGDGGLFLQVNQEDWRRIDVDLDEPIMGIVSGSLINESELWLATFQSGVVRLDVSAPGDVRLLQGGNVPEAPDATVYSVVSDSTGRVYVCSNNGVQLLTPNDSGGYRSRVFKRADGLVHDECNSNGQFVDSSDRYWVGTLGGLSLYDPSVRIPRRASTAKPIHLTAVTMNGQTLPETPNGGVDVPPGVRELRFDFALLSGLREYDNRYRSQLLGYESEMSSWGTAHTRFFTDLAPGEYRLRVEATSHSGASGLPLDLPVRVRGYWWQNRGVHWGSAGLLVAMTLGGWLLYNRRMRRRQELLRDTVAERTRELQMANERLLELSNRDTLTGLANRRRLMEVLQQELQRTRERGLNLGLIMVDVDHFKRYNDTFGHVAGDVALSAVAHVLGAAVRRKDLVARLGGEEFACLVTESDLATVCAIAERMRAEVAALTPRQIGNDSERLTISAGVMLCVPEAGDTVSTLLSRCDAALYEAKDLGRNQVRVLPCTQTASVKG